MADEGTANCVDILLAIILPPLGVFLKFGCEMEFWICLLLTSENCCPMVDVTPHCSMDDSYLLCKIVIYFFLLGALSELSSRLCLCRSCLLYVFCYL
ncbi:hypothetical protein OPV22_001241 [Ensete ventricosum]|uniref:Hydrophobic seed protein domain-containing protein n=1 Tax=Ensete ventricosum TaxID=4639 RepID=A0AAV8RPT6_ENSVE|nr:hypothetical protein OPV22_001241 [Ensete ventricosum]